MLPDNISEAKRQDFKDKKYDLFRQKYGLVCPVDYRISYFVLEDILKDANVKSICEKEQKDLLKDKKLWGRYLKSQYSINVLPIPEYKATVFGSLKATLRNSLQIERSIFHRPELPKKLIIGLPIVEVTDRGNLMTFTIDIQHHTLTQITNGLRKTLMCLRERFKEERMRQDADEDCLRIYNLKEQGKPWREIIDMQKRNSGEYHDRLRHMKRQYVKAKRLIEGVTR